MLDMGFIHALRRIAPELGTPRQTMLFSATMPKQMAELSSAYLSNPARIEVAKPGKAADKITQGIHWAQDKSDKLRILKERLAAEPEGLALVFGRTKHGSEKLMKDLVKAGFNAVSIHGNKSQGQRERALKAFKDGDARILVATDVAARGIDIPGVSHVYNFDLPEVPENYVHRIGRTARAGADGDAISFVAGVEIGLLKQIEKMMKITIPVIGGERPAEEKPAPRGKRGGGGGGRRQGPPRTSRGPKPANASGKPTGNSNGKPGKPSGKTLARKKRRQRARSAA
ncbi:MAG: DEAD/DEAH box helicase, partial [Rhodobacteraceae bacterium]|nr:DEAD/DEAH box helicase [Paracoccaceae bacterium]